jgi:hypothetical protein
MGGFCSFSGNFSPVDYCIVHLAHAQHLNISPSDYWLLVNLGD